MKKHLTHPLWTHLPVLGLLIFLGIRLAAAGNLPARAPTHFGFNGQPDAWGSPWVTFGLTLGLTLLFGVISLILDEAWVRSERRKSFNWMSLFDELTAGCLTGISLGYLNMFKSGESVFSFPLAELLLTTAVAVALAVILEFLRPFRPNPQTLVIEDTTIFEKELAQRLRENRVFIFWQSQNPLWNSILSILLPLVLLVVAVVMWFSLPWFSLLYVVIAAALGLMYGGMRTIVTRESITVRLGILGIRLLKVKNSEIGASEIMQFSPIKDFGGYGIRFNGKMYAYYLRGNRGIKISLRHGVQYLIGSDRPEQLLAVIKAVEGKHGGGELKS